MDFKNYKEIEETGTIEGLLWITGLLSLIASVIIGIMVMVTYGAIGGMVIFIGALATALIQLGISTIITNQRKILRLINKKEEE